MAQDFMTMTPGSAVADQLQEILARKRVEAQNNLIMQLKQQEMGLNRDKFDLDRQNVESEIAHRAATAKNTEAQTQSLAEQRHQAEVDKRLGRIQPDMDLAPEDAAFVLKENPSNFVPPQPGDEPLPPDVEGPTRAAIGPRYKGLPVYQQQKETESRLQDLQDKARNNPDLSPDEILFELAKIFPGKDPMASFEKYYTSKTTQAPGHLKVYDPDLKKVVDYGEIGVNDKTIESSRAPLGPQPPQVSPEPHFEIVDKDGNRVAARLDPKTGVLVPVPTAPGYTYGGKANADTPPPKPPMITTSDVRALGQANLALKRARDADSYHPFGGVNPDVTAAQQVVDSIKAKMKTVFPASLQTAVSKIMDDPYLDQRSVTDIVDALEASRKSVAERTGDPSVLLTKEEKNILLNQLPILLGKVK